MGDVLGWMRQNVPGVKQLADAGDIMARGLDLINKVLNLLTNPQKLIPYLFTLIFGLLFGAWLLCVHTIWSISIFNEVLFWLYFIFVTLLFEIVVSIVFIAIFTLLVVIDIVLWLLDLITFGAIRFITRCEETPDSWYKRGNFVYDNITRAIFLCQYPCGMRFKPSNMGGFVCMRNDQFETPFCPQSQIYRLYKGETIETPSIMNDFVPDLQFWTKSPEDRKEQIGVFFDKRQAFLNKCCAKMEPYKDVIKNVCANFDTVHLPHDTPANRQLLKGLCCQAFCQGGDNAGEGKPSFCADMGCQTSVQQRGGNEASIVGISDVSEKIMNVVTMILLSTIIVAMFLYRETISDSIRIAGRKIKGIGK
jgi:hypothetical protein